MIRIRGLELDVYLGVRDDEQTAPRLAIADIALEIDLEKASRTDDLADTVDYDVLCEAVRRHCSPHQYGGAPRRYALIERLAGEIAEICLAFDGRIEAAEVTVGKPGAVNGAHAVEVNMAVSRPGHPIARTSQPRDGEIV